MIQKKICMLGGFAVGKTSLVSRFVRSIFSEKYHTTIGVKVDKKVVQIGDRDLSLILWDIYGEDEFQKLRTSYLRGAAGYLLVVDGTRQATLDRAQIIKRTVDEAVGELPFILVLNKVDLVDDWELDDSVLDELGDAGWTIVRSSAKTGQGVEEAFASLANGLLA